MSVPVRDEAPKAGRWEWRDHLPSSLKEARAFAERALDLGVHPQAALGFYRWCLEHLDGSEPDVAVSTGTKYRKILLRLAQDRLKGQPDAAVVEHVGHDAMLERAARREIRAQLTERGPLATAA